MLDFLIRFVNLIIDNVAIAATWLLDFLPESPFSYLENSPVAEYLPVINWFIPVEAIVNVLTVWITAVAGYYLLAIVMRWVKAIN